MSPATLPLEPVPERSLRDDPLYEVVGGQIVELPPMGAYQTSIASELLYFLLAHVKPHKLGRVVGETLFILDEENRLKRRPDVAFVSYDRWPRSRRVPDVEGWNVVPELAVEVVSPSNTADEVVGKIGEYFEAGCQRVWVIYPTEEQAYVYQSATRNAILALGDDLDGETVVPGFRLPLKQLFPDEEV
jgi:Uma2 family endonuclease